MSMHMDLRGEPGKPLMMGVGDHSAARVYEHVTTLLRLFDELSGIQQMGIGPTPSTIEEQKEEYDKWFEKASMFIFHLSRDFGLSLKVRDIK